MKKVLLIFTFFTVHLFFPSQMSAQQSEIIGVVQDAKSQEPVAGANILFLSPTDSTLIKGEVTNLDGNFQIKVPYDEYLLKVSFVGYGAYYENLNISEEQINLGSIRIAESEFQLAEVIIVGRVPPVKQRGDTLQFNASAFKTNRDASSEQLLEKMPGVLTVDGKVQVQGEDVKKVLIDGRPFFGDDPNAALKNLPAEIVAQIEMYDALSDKSNLTGFDDGNYEKTINIITKPEFRNGVFGKVLGGYGTDNRYLFNGVVNVFNDDQRLTVLAQSNNVNQQNFSTADLAGVAAGSGSRGSGGGGRRGGGGGGKRGGGGGRGGASSSGNVNDFLIGEQGGITETNAVGVNYSDEFGEKLDFTGSYFYNNTKNNTEIKTSRTYFTDGPRAQTYNSEELSNSINTNNRFNFRLNYDLNEKNKIIMTPQFTKQDNSGYSEEMGILRTGNNIENSFVNSFYGEVDTYDFSNSITWNHIFNKSQSLTISSGQQLKKTLAENELESITEYENDGDDLLIQQQSALDQDENSVSLGFDFNQKITDSLLLQFTYSNELNESNSEKRTFDFNDETNQYDNLNNRLSNINETEYFEQEAGAGIRWNSGNHSLNFSAAYQWSQLNSIYDHPYEYELSNKYQNLIPSLTWRWNISAQQKLRLNIQRRTHIPSISQLQEVLDNSSPQQLFIGNSELDQQQENSFQFRYSSINSSKESSFFVLGSASTTSNFVGESVFFNNSDEAIIVDEILLEPGVQLSQPINMDGNYNLRIFSSYGEPIDPLKSNLNFSLSSQYEKSPGLINGETNYQNNSRLQFGVVLSSNFSENVDFTLSSNSSYSKSSNSLDSNLDNNQFTQRTNFRFYWKFLEKVVYQTNVAHQYNNDVNEGIDNNALIWNMSLGMKFLKDDRGQISLTAHDLLNQNQSLNRITTTTYFEDVKTNALQRYFMLSFQYDLRFF